MTCYTRRPNENERPKPLASSSIASYWVNDLHLIVLSLIVKLNRDFHRAGDVKRSYARIYLPDDDYAGLGNFLAVLAIVNGYVVRGRPISQDSNLVSVRSLSFVRDGARQMTEFFAAEQVIHCER
jgi:hypothetical protein